MSCSRTLCRCSSEHSPWDAPSDCQDARAFFGLNDRGKTASIPGGESAETANPSATVDAWLAAQNGGDFKAYASLYAPAFKGVKKAGSRETEYDRATWLKDRRSMFKMPMKVTATDREIQASDYSTVVLFTQHWSSGTFADRGRKKLVFINGHITWEEILTSEVVSRHAHAWAAPPTC